MANLEKLSTLIPLHQLEQEAQQQIYNALELDFLKKLAIMPDCHTGYTLPIGGVALLDNVISPEYVGYDIGCGVCHLETDTTVHKLLKTKKKREALLQSIYDMIPVGFNSRHSPIEYQDFKSASANKELNNRVKAKIFRQVGTLGGGNHFIEVGENQKKNVTITIHSGSRNIGHTIATYYMNQSKLIDKDLPNGFLHLNGDVGQQYLKDMNYCLDYALANRRVMMEIILSLFGYQPHEVNKMIEGKMINENHNHAIAQGTDVLHRKGATPSEKGQLGIIPGNMMVGTYITEGLGNEEYLSSSSHGAGRKMSRRKAKEKIDLSRVKEQMKNITVNINKDIKDEAPDAYKNVKEVIAAQEGIVVKTIDHAKPLIVAKG